MSERYQQSEALLARALKTIPLGAQTFSKSQTQYPFGVSPYFISKAQGCRVWDVDGNEYIDFVSSLAAITLGYNDPDVNAAVHAQVDAGVIFSLPHRLEMEVAERLVAMVPCAEQVRFGKNGSDATAGAVRLARAYTQRERVAVCGYHGWQDWYIGSTARHRGVPEAVRALTHSFPFNDLAALEALLAAHPGEFACVMLEPMNVLAPSPGYLAEVRACAHRHGALLVFDETITGFRFANGGAQAYFGVTPDLATFGKGLANGYPLSAIVGRADVMALMSEIFFSFTFGGETLSLAAAAATLDKLEREPVINTLASLGEQLKDGLNALIAEQGLSDYLACSGHPSWTFLLIKDAPGCTQWEAKTLLMQEMLARGMLWIGTHNLNYAHQSADIAALLAAYAEVLPLLKQAIASARPRDFLRCEPLQALFKIR
ncbi:MAG: aminotransferase class III-fold pyridoxal phosphate-dependent enzyme [Pseudomonadota bacterium]